MGTPNTLRLCALLAGLLAGTPDLGAQTPGELLRDANRAANGTIVIEGKVVGSDGRPLPGVRVHARRSIASGWEGRSIENQYTIDGSFRLVFEGNRGVSLDFMCDGYHYEHFDYSITRPDAAAVIDGRTHTYRDVNVVLRKIGKLAALHSYGVTLSSTREGPMTAWDLGALGTQKSSPVLKERVANGPAAVAEPVAYAAVVPAVGALPPLVVDGHVLRPADSVIRVVIADGGEGGFIPLREPVPAGEVRYPMRRMREAPETGYAPALDVNDAELPGLLQCKPLYFYCRLKMLYGKGRLAMVFFDARHDTLEVRMDIWLQPDGSRNVETTQ